VRAGSLFRWPLELSVAGEAEKGGGGDDWIPD